MYGLISSLQYRQYVGLGVISIVAFCRVVSSRRVLVFYDELSNRHHTYIHSELYAEATCSIERLFQVSQAGSSNLTNHSFIWTRASLLPVFNTIIICYEYTVRSVATQLNFIIVLYIIL